MALKRAARGRRIAWGAAVLTIILGSAGVWAGRQAILESWWIHRLDSHDAKVRKEAAESLGRWGSARAAAALAEGFERGNPDALRILGEIERRADAQTRIVIVRRLLGLVEPLERRGLSGGEDIFSDLIQVLASAGTHTPEAFPLLIDALDRKGLTRCVAAIALARAWPASAGGLHAFLSTASLEQAGGLLGFLACHRPTAGEDTTAPELQALPAQAVREMLFALARDHQRPEIRALAVAAAAIEAAQNPSEEPDLEFLRGAFKSDRDPLVRRAALRSAGFLGHVPGNLGLPRLLLEEHDVATLREIIQARTLWASKLEPAELEVLEGIVLSAGKRPEKAEPLPLEPPEVARLEEVLSRERDPALRDAASVALSTLGNAAGSPPAPIAGLVVHEWGVWREAGSTLLSAVKLAAADLPGFVHRSRVSLSEFRAARTGSQLQGGKSVTLTGVNFKPVIFFRAPRPVSLRVRVYFHRGRPWTFFPDATDYLQGQISEEEPVQEEALGFAPRDDSDATCPPWIAKEAGKPVPASGDLKGRYPLVPWLLPAPSNVPGAGVIDGLGLEWRGLRVGYGEDLEGPLPPAPKDGEAGSWWTHLRNVPASPVALRGERDRFLFYEGANGLPSPLLVRWLDGSRKSLVLRTRDFRTIPKLTQWSGFTVEDLRRRGLEPPLCTEHLPGALVIHKEAGRAPRGRFVANFPSGSPPVRVELAALDLEGEPLRDRLREILAARGLTTEETLALLRSWEREFFERDGLRVLTVLPRWTYDGLLPLDIDPAPEEIVRVGLVWKECDGSLEIEPPASAPGSRTEYPQRTIEWTTSRVAIRERPLEPGPVDTFEVEPSGRLIGIDPAAESSFLLSAEGRRFAHAVRNWLTPEVRTVDLETRTFRRLIRFPPFRSIEEICISRDGSRIGVIVQADDGKWSLRVLDVLRGVVLEVFDAERALMRSSLPGDGRTLAFLDEGLVPHLVDLETASVRTPQLPQAVLFHPTVFTANGQKAALFLLDPARNDGWGVGLLDLAGGRLLTVNDPLEQVKWSVPVTNVAVPSDDGRRVLYRPSDEDQAALRLADLEKGTILTLPKHEGQHAALPTLTGDGKRVIFARPESIWAIDLDTGESKPLARFPGLRLDEGSASADGRRVLFAVRGYDRRQGVYLVEAK